MLRLYLMGLDLSNRQIARELDLSQPYVRLMTERLRHGLAAQLPAVVLDGEVEIDEVYVAAGHKGNPAAVAKRGGRVVVRMLANMRQAAIRPVIEGNVARGALVHTNEHDISARPEEWGYGHETACHAKGEYVRDGDGDGFCEVHVDTTEGVWSLLGSWLCPHRGISQEKLPLHLALFQFVHNARRRGKAFLGELAALAA